MKLWLCKAVGSHSDPSGLVVAKTEKEAIQKFIESLNGNDVYYYYSSVSAEVVNDVGG